MRKLTYDINSKINSTLDNIKADISYLYSCNVDNWRMWDSFKDKRALELYLSNKTEIDSLKQTRDDLIEIKTKARENNYYISDEDYSKLASILLSGGERYVKKD